MEVYTSLVLAGLSVSFFHAILPNHWLPFVLAGRAQRWSMGKTLSVVTLAGGGHVLITTLLGVLIVGMGLTLAAYVEAWAGPLAATVLILFGLYYIVQHFRGAGHGHTHFSGFEHATEDHGHSHDDHSHSHEDDHEHKVIKIMHISDDHDHSHNHDLGHSHDYVHAPDQGQSHDGHDHAHGEKSGRKFAPDTIAVASLIAMLTFSPCEGFLPIYLTAWPYGWMAFAVLSVVLAVGTLAGMMLFTGLTFAGIQKLELPWLERFEHLILGGVLVLLGIAVVFLHL